MTGMWTLIRNGGAPMIFILLTGLVGLAAAFHFALRARRESLGFIKGLAAATLFGTLAASCADVGTTLYATEKALQEASERGSASSRDRVPGGGAASASVNQEATNDSIAPAFHLMVEGLAESTSPGILGFSFLALTGMLVAVGRRRLDARIGAS
jgi:hypothetical protein